MNKLFELLLLKELPGVGNVKINKEYIEYLKRNTSEDTLRDLLINNEKKITDEVFETAKVKARNKCDTLTSREDIYVITVLDDDYPERFNELGTSKPPVLYVKGNKEVLNMRSIGIVGTREPSEWSKKVEKQFIEKMPAENEVIVSGLALGCDAIAHKEALSRGIKTMAILPSGFDNIVPKENVPIADEILNSDGCLVSEYSPEEKAGRYTFTDRDKLIAAASDSLMVIECGVKSGTMHTVEAAKRLGRIIGCYYCEDKTRGNYKGNDYILNNGTAIKIDNKEALYKLFERSSSYAKAVTEKYGQMKLFE